MTTPADDGAVEDAFEAYLAGRRVPEEAADLAVFSDAVRATATTPGRPNAALAELLATGLLTDQSSPSARTARSAGAPPSRGTSRTRNRRRFAMIFPALLAKILSAGAAAQAATGAGIVVVVVGGAGATGVLGEEVQDGISSVVTTAEDETPDVIPDDDTLADDGEPVAPNPGTVDGQDPVTTVPVQPVDELAVAAEAWAAGPAADAPFGQWVSRAAGDKELRAQLEKMGYGFSDLVRTWAHNKGLRDEDLAHEGVDLGDLTGETGELTPETEPVETEDATDDRESGKDKDKDKDKDKGKHKDKSRDRDRDRDRGRDTGTSKGDAENDGGGKGNGRD